MSTPFRPAWMPQLHTLDACAAGRDWDAIVVPQTRGLDALMVLDHGTVHSPGPVIWDTAQGLPRLYFLVAPGTAADWDVAGTRACGRGSFVVVPGADALTPPGPHWLCPPDPDNPAGLVDAGLLREALSQLRGAAA